MYQIHVLKILNNSLFKRLVFFEYYVSLVIVMNKSTHIPGHFPKTLHANFPVLQLCMETTKP